MTTEQLQQIDQARRYAEQDDYVVTRTHIRNLLAIIEGQATSVPDGWKLVPVEPAWEMLNACAADWQARGMFGLDTLDARAAYSAMLAAAPEEPKYEPICGLVLPGQKAPL